MPFAVSVAQSDEVLVLRVAGELDLESAATLQNRVSELLPPGGTEVVLDLRQVEFIDSSGLRALLGLRDDAKRNGHALTLIPPPPLAQRVFEITGTQGLFDWRSDRAGRNGSVHPSGTSPAEQP